VRFAADRLKRRASDLAVEDVDPELVLAFLDHVEGERGNAARSRNARFAAIPRSSAVSSTRPQPAWNILRIVAQMMLGQGVAEEHTSKTPPAMHMNVMQDTAIALMISPSWETTGEFTSQYFSEETVFHPTFSSRPLARSRCMHSTECGRRRSAAHCWRGMF
jgi:hypothetical protein